MLGLAGATAAHAQIAVDILRIYQDFVASAVAQQKCGVADEDLHRKFLANMAAVSTRAAQALKERNPTATDEALGHAMAEFKDRITAGVEAEIAARGCQSPKIQRQLRVYTRQANMNPGGSLPDPLAPAPRP